MRYVYPVELARDEDGRMVVSFPDVPEALTDGASEEEALREARDALAVALGGYVLAQRAIPRPSSSGGHEIPVPPLLAAKLALYRAMRNGGISNMELARRLGVSEGVIRRLVNPEHASRIDKVWAALAALHGELIIEDAA